MTDPRYWDCDCETRYIHRKSQRLECPVCGAQESDGRPDSRVREVAIPELHYEWSEDDIA